MNKAVNIIKRIILFFIGMSIIQLGVALFLKTNIGSDPFTVFTQGLANTLNETFVKNLQTVNMISGGNGVTPGVANMLILIVLFVVILTVDKKKINAGTLICVAGVGPIIDFGVKVISYFPVDTYNYGVRMVLVASGCFVIAIGFSVLSASNLGVAPNDIIPFIIKDKIKSEYKWIRISLDAIFLVAGFILGGTVGVGTVISMIFTGPFIQFCLPYGENIVKFFTKESKIQYKDLAQGI